MYDRRDLVREPGGLLRCQTEGDGRDTVTLTRDSVATAEVWAQRKVPQIHDPGQLEKGVPEPIGGLPLSGSGSPEGVVVARPGTVYTDTSSGAEYSKASGFGNTGWELAS